MNCTRCPHTREEHGIVGCNGQPTRFGQKLCMCWWFEPKPRLGIEHRWSHSSAGRAPGFTAMEAAGSIPAATAKPSRLRLIAMVLLFFVLPAGAKDKKFAHPKNPGLVIYCENGTLTQGGAEGQNCVLHDRQKGSSSYTISVYGYNQDWMP